jgi:hypothetical protein
MVDHNQKLSTLIAGIIFFGLVFVGSFATFGIFRFEAELLTRKPDTNTIQAFAGKFTAQLPGIPKNMLQEKRLRLEKSVPLQTSRDPQESITLAVNLLLVSGGIVISIIGFIFYLLKREKTHQH